MGEEVLEHLPKWYGQFKKLLAEVKIEKKESKVNS
jgi:hypothetical protein